MKDTKISKLLWLMIIIYIILFSFICFNKYQNFHYNGLDLAIFNQVFYNSSTGNFFDFTIHPHSYLGDHFTPILILLLPFYFIFKNPLSLLALQTIILALSAWPIYLIADKKRVGLIFAALFLLNPFVQNINLFEFHLLPFAIFFLLFAFYFYQKRKFLPFLIFIILSLLVREDVSLIIFMFGILALIDSFKTNPNLTNPLKAISYQLPANLKWFLVPLILGLLWFIFSLKIIGHFSPGKNYKFLFYYTWLGDSPLEIIKNLFLHPLTALGHLLRISNLEMILGFLLPFAFLTLFRPKHLLLSLAVFAQMLLGAPGGSSLILETHYASLFLPALFIATITSFKTLSSLKPKKDKKSLFYLWRDQNFWLLLLIIATVYTNVTLGPISYLWEKNVEGTQNLSQIKDYFVDQIPKEASVATTYEFLPHLSSRKKLYSLHYAFIGKKQYSNEDYVLPDDTEYLLVDFKDIITYGFQYPNHPLYSQFYPQGDNNLRRLIEEKKFGLVEINNTMALFKKDYPSDSLPLFEIISPSQFSDDKTDVSLASIHIFDDKIKLLEPNRLPDTPEYPPSITQNQGLKLVGYNFKWQALKKLEENYQLELKLTDQNSNIIWQKFYPLVYGIYPTSEWGTDEIISTNYWFLLPQKKSSKEDYQLSLSLVSLEGGVELDSQRSVVEVIDKKMMIGETLILR